MGATWSQKAAIFDDFDSTTGRVRAGGSWNGYTSIGMNYTYVDVSVPELTTAEASQELSLVAQDSNPEQVYQDFYNYTIQDLIASDKIMVVLGSGTANGLIIDASGQRLGYVGGAFVDEIPGTTYEIGDLNYVEIYRLPADRIYTFKTSGTSDDTFALYSMVPQSDGTLQVTNYEDVPTTSSSTATISISRNNTDFDLQNDLDGDGTTDQTEAPDYQGTAEATGNDVYLPIILKKS